MLVNILVMNIDGIKRERERECAPENESPHCDVITPSMTKK